MRIRLLSVVLGLFTSASFLPAASLLIPNGSFESPTNDLASPAMDAWQKAPPPFWFPGTMEMWEQTMGQFLNTPEGAPNHIDNLDGHQAAYLFALPDLAIFQDYSAIVSGQAPPTHSFNVLYEAEKSYALSVGVLGGGGGMSNGATFQISLYYRDASSNAVTVAALVITNSLELFPTNTHFLDFQVRTPVVRADDAWAGKHIGVRLASTVGFELQNGYWDVDNVRLTESVVPNGSFESPETDLASPTMDSWQKSPPPVWFPGTSEMWEQTMGQFLNTPYPSPNHLDNMDGEQAAYLFALPEVAISQDSIRGGNTELLPASYELGNSYALTVAVLGGGGGMSNGATLAISFYYRNGNDDQVAIATTSITNSLELFPTNTHFLDFQVCTPIVRANDPWAGQDIGIRIASTVGFELQNGYWDVDHVRVTKSVLPNHSFETPETDLAAPDMDGWQKAPPPVWFPGAPEMWAQTMGQFLNTPPGAPSHIDNLDGEQAAYLFALPEAAIFQDYISLGGTNTQPTHDFNLKFDVAKVYALAVGVLGGGGGMSNGATLEISFYYRDANSNQVTVASTTITNSLMLFPTNTHFTDFQVLTPFVKETDAWAGQYVGVRIASTVGFDLQNGYWDVDNVRIRTIQAPLLTDFGVTGDQIGFTLQSAPGRFEILGAADVAGSGWSSVATLTNVSGTISFSEAVSDSVRFYRARPSP